MVSLLDVSSPGCSVTLVAIFRYQVCIHIPNLDFGYLFRHFWVLANYSTTITFAEVSKGDHWKGEKGKGLDLGTFSKVSGTALGKEPGD